MRARVSTLRAPRYGSQFLEVAMLMLRVAECAVPYSLESESPKRVELFLQVWQLGLAFRITQIAILTYIIVQFVRIPKVQIA